MEMKNNHSVLILLLLFLCFSFNINLSLGGDTISANESLSIGQTISSSGGKFELGFFRPGDSPNYYIGIWYANIYPQTVVWVANRETPVTTSEPKLSIIQGNLVLVDQLQNTIWSTDVENVTTNDSFISFLRDDGNLILSHVSNSSKPLPIWQSFDYPTHAFLPGAKLGYDKRTNKSQVLISWKDSSDPSPGLFSLELDPKLAQFVIKWNRTKQYWQSGSWDGNRFSLVPEMTLNYIYNFSYTENENESYFTYSNYNSSIPPLSRLLLDISGQIKQITWIGNRIGWYLFWSQPRKQCEVYAYCGAFGVCDNANSSCSCLSGFKSRSDSKWSSNDYSGGCVRNEKLQCSTITEDDDSLWMNLSMGLPAQDTNITVGEASQCRSTCFNDCSCTAYSYDGSGTCSILTGDLLNLQQLSVNETGRTISVKLGSPQAQNKAKKSTKGKAIIAAVTTSMVVLMCSFGCICYRRRITKRKERHKATQRIQIVHLLKAEREAKELMNENDDQVIDVPYFALETILEATSNFSNANKLGQGGFGPVYKGIFPGGKEIAVKRLSTHSGQGIDEFKNEVTLIAKLQHRNLVRLLGYCINAVEQILLYEYMPNKSLDKFIFDGTLKSLDWSKRYDIILGIARGLVYLHHDSRLKIIHRDFKTSNILLDEEMNPKISDFGLARIVVGKRTEVNTSKVVGTYGYMSPEYALDGTFSIKSDVFSFGVVVLEIITGRRNTGFYQSEEALNLLGYAWRFWIEDSAIQLVEKSLLESCNRSEVMKCINVALLCVQEDPNDRPSMSDVIVMLGGDGMNLPRPNQPAFVMRTRTSTTSSSSSSKSYIASNNQMTITTEEGR